MLKKDQIADVLFEETNETEDDGDALFEGELFITLTNGQKKRVELDWVRLGHYYEFLDSNKQVRIDAVVDYQRVYNKDLTKMWTDWV